MFEQISAELINLAVKGTVSNIATRIKTIKEEKNTEVLRNSYEGIINELISEREEAVRIAQLLKFELDRIKISDTDMIHLNRTIESVLTIIKEMGFPSTSFEPIKALINADTLKAMQLLGFNFKEAIGNPLTKLCADAISSKAKFIPRKK